jgi:hypothetical protein
VEEDTLKRKREAEFELLTRAGEENDEEFDADDANNTSSDDPQQALSRRDSLDYDDNDMSPRLTERSRARTASDAPAVTPGHSHAANTHSGSSHQVSKKRKLQASLIHKFIEPAFAMFESNRPELTMDEFGASIDDLHFQDVTTMQFQKYVVFMCLCVACAFVLYLHFAGIYIQVKSRKTNSKWQGRCLSAAATIRVTGWRRSRTIEGKCAAAGFR